MQDFPEGVPTSKEGVLTYFFAKNCMKVKESGASGGTHTWYPRSSLTGFFKINLLLNAIQAKQVVLNWTKVERSASWPSLDPLLFVDTLSENIWQKEKEFNAEGSISIALAFLDTMCYQLYLLSSFSFVT